MIKTIIVEDEIMALKSLEKLCKKYSELDLVGMYENGEDALESIKSTNVDLILLDIDMPGMSGLDLVEKIPNLPQVVFTTGNTEYAYEAYEYDITDFLKKPISPDRFKKAIEKVHNTLEKRNAVSLASEMHELYIKTDGKYIRLGYPDILYFENVGDYIKAITSHGTYIFHDTMKSLDNKITNPRFLKVHRSYIINMQWIKDFKDNTVVIKDKVIPVSRAYKSVLLGSINLI
jgi:DNA-binding LytR/AlgR family response regulator